MVKPDVTMDQLMSHVRALSEQFPHRFTGEPEERLAAEYVATAMKEIGLKVRFIEVPVMGWEVELPPSLRLISPLEEDIECAALAYSGSTPADGLEGELEYVGPTVVAGGYDWEKYAIVDVHTRDWRGFVIGRPDGPAITQVGPASGSAGAQDTLPYLWPSCIVGKEHLERIQAWQADGKQVCVRYQCQSVFKPDCKSFIVHGVLRGKSDPDSVVIMGAHHDCQGAIGFPENLNSPGANDNASSEAIFLELAHHYVKHGSPKTLWFLSFGGEERNLIMSREFARMLTESGELKRVVAGVFTDQAARGDKLLLFSSDDEAKVRPQFPMRRIVEEVAEELHVRQRFNVIGPAAPIPVSDHWPFYFSGVPLFYMGWHPFEGYHRSGDNVAALTEDDKFLTTFQLVAGVLERILSLDIHAPVERSEYACYVTSTDLQ